MLIGFTSYWSVFDAKALKNNSHDQRPLLAQQQIKRGRILAADGSVIARSVPIGHGSSLRYVRRYPQGALFGHPIGYSFARQGDSEFEHSHNEELAGTSSEFGSILDQLSGTNREGDDVVTNLERARSGSCADGLQATGFGAVVAIEPRTGRVRVMASNPSLQPQPGSARTSPSSRSQPRHAGPVPTRLDLQGGDRRCGAEQRHDHAGNDDKRAGDAGSPGPAAANGSDQSFGSISLGPR